MEAFDEHMAKQLPNFTRFAEQFTKVFIPIIDTAINMSSNEPVSAYSVFKAAKEMAGTCKKSKKKQNATKKKDNCKGAKKGAGDTKKLTDKPAGVDATKPVKNNNKTTVIDAANVTLASAVNKTKSQSLENKKANTGGKGLNEGGNSANVKEINATDIEHKEASDADVKGYEIITLRDKLYPSNEKTLSKRNLKIREEFKDYVVIQVRGQKNLLGEDEDSFSSEGSEGELDEREAGYSNSYDSSNLILSESGSFSEEDHNAQTDSYSDEQSLSTNEEDNQAAAFVPPIMLSKANKKRKSTDTAKDKSKDTLVNSAVETKKPKRVEETAKPASRKSLPSSAAVEESSKNSLTSKTSNKIANVKLEPLLPPSNVVKVNSIEEGKRAFKWLLNPVPVDVFFSKYWERAACLIKRQQDNYFTHLISFEAIDKMLLKNHVEFTRNIDVTSYQNGVRQTLNPEGRALPPVVWDHYGQGCSIRLLNPQTFLPGLFSLSTTMQEYFHCLVGANAYLTPPNSQGFAPHYDDIEAFVLQIEGRKRWKLYKPRRRTEALPRYSSKNFEQQEIGKPVLEEVLEPGDVLYFPRGTIHQACTEPGYHSLHITLSVYQRQSFADLFETMLPMMLQKAITSNVNLRKGLPLNAWQNAGIAFSENNTKERTVLIKQVNQLLQKSLREMPLKSVMDAAMDQLAKKFQHEALPPEILPAEKLRTVFGSRSRANERGECICDYDIDERTNVRLLRANILRLVEEEGKLRIYYYLDNSKVYCEYEPNFIEIDKFEAASVEVLIKSYPQYVGVSQLPLPSDEQKITLVLALWERGLLMMEKPFK